MWAGWPRICPGSAKLSAMLASSGSRADTGYSLVRQGIRARPEPSLHHDDIDPAAELETDRRQDADMREAQLLMQTDRAGGLAPADHRHHLPVAEFAATRDHLLQQGPAEAAADLAGLDIERILDRKTIRHARPGPP